MNRALYSLIQFTTITLLYSFASSLGDFQVGGRPLCVAPPTKSYPAKFLYIDLFIIIPIAVTSEKLLNNESPFGARSDEFFHLFSGKIPSLPENPCEASDGEFGVKEGAR